MAGTRKVESGIENVAMAVIYQAVEDYSKACIGLTELDGGLTEKMRENKEKRCKKMVMDCLVFFRQSLICEIYIDDIEGFIYQIDKRVEKGLTFDRAHMIWK